MKRYATFTNQIEKTYFGCEVKIKSRTAHEV